MHVYVLLSPSEVHLKMSQPGYSTICCCLIAKSCVTSATPWTVAHQAPLSMGFLRQEPELVAISFSRGSS